MRPADIAALAAEMAALGVARLELTGPDFSLTLGRGAAPMGAATEADEVGQAEVGLVPLTAPALGAFLRAHPLHERPLAADGEAVVAGQPIALLRVGALLAPVLAPADGMIVAALPAEGALVGFGDPLFDFQPQD